MAANPDKQNPASPLLWHVAYVKSRSEKKVKERLDRMGIQAFLPLIKTVRQWLQLTLLQKANRWLLISAH